MKSIFKILVLSIIIFSIASCNHSNTLGKMIPHDAIIIVHLNGRALTAKLTWEEIKKSAWFAKATTDSNMESWMKNAMENPEVTGMDNKGDLVMFVQKNNTSEGNIVFEGDVKDEKKLESFYTNISTGAISKIGDQKFMTLKNNGEVGWNSKKFILVFNKKLPSIKDSSIAQHTGYTDSSDLKTTCSNLFSLKEDSSMTNNNNFTTLLNDPADMHIWQNTEEMLKIGPSLGMLGMLKLDVFIKNNVSTYSVNFEDGKIDVKQRWYASKELMDVVSKYGGGKINEQMIKNIPTQDIVAFISLHFKPQGIQELLRLSGMDGLVNLFVSKQGFSIDDFVAANKGDILITMSNFKINKDSTSDTSKKYHPSANYLFAASIEDKKAFNKLIAAGSKIGSNMKKDSGVTYMMNDKFFVLGNDATAVNKYNSGANNSFSFLDEIKDHSFAAYIDINKILASVAASNPTDTASKAFLNANARVWDKVVMTGGEIEDGAYHVHDVITMIDRKTNSLKQLNGLLDIASTLHHGHHGKLHESLDTASTHRYMDSTTVK